MAFLMNGCAIKIMGKIQMENQPMAVRITTQMPEDSIAGYRA
jgi:hypothetical protein